MKKRTLLSLAISSLVMVSSSTVQHGEFGVSKLVNEIKSKQTKVFFKVGSPYKRNGKVYRPHIYANYKKTGKASWYGPGFHGKQTANGDVFNANDITAAHPTLPLYSRVWVTNLENGKRILVTVNDRGPYHDNRIMDLSSRAADILGYKKKGTVDIKVELDLKETIKLLKEKGLYDQYLKASHK